MKITYQNAGNAPETKNVFKDIAEAGQAEIVKFQRFKITMK